MRKSKVIKKIRLLIIVVLVGIGLIAYFIFRSPYKFRGKQPVKIFILNSHEPEFPLLVENLTAFKKVFADNKITIDTKEFDMDVSKNNTDESFKNVSSEAKKNIDDYKPDLIYAIDDEAQLVVKDYINTKIPIIFVGVNKNPKDYGYDKSRNVAGVLEREKIVDVLNYLKNLYPNKIRKVAAISYDLPMWRTVFERLGEESKKITDVEFTNWDLVTTMDDLDEKILEYQTRDDAILLFDMGPFIPTNPIKSIETVVSFLDKNSKIPEATFWGQMVKMGMLLSVEASQTEQGRVAGNMANAILIEGVLPKAIGFEEIEKSSTYLNINRVKNLGLDPKKIPSIILVNSNIVGGSLLEVNNYGK